MKPLLTLATHERAYVSFFVDQFPEDMAKLKKIIPSQGKITLIFASPTPGGDVQMAVLDRAAIPNPGKASTEVAAEQFEHDARYQRA